MQSQLFEDNKYIKEISQKIIANEKSNLLSLRGYTKEDIKRIFSDSNTTKLYKYCSLDKNRLMSLIKHQVFGSYPQNFNDPLDGYLVTQLLGSIKNNNYFNYDKKGSGVDTRKLQELRVTCLSTKAPYSPDSTIMWAHYADNHRGICLEYNIELILECVTNQFNLSGCCEDELLMLPCFYHGDKDYEVLEKLKLMSVFYKHKAWSYEEEVRVIFKQPYITIKPSIIYLGCKISNSDKEFLLSEFDDKCGDFQVDVNEMITPQTFGYKKYGQGV